MWRFEWDDTKAEANLNKHSVNFDEAQSVFLDPLARIVDDVEHSHDEDRAAVIGMSYQHRLLVVIFTDRNRNIRLISARKATRKERIDYETGSIA